MENCKNILCETLGVFEVPHVNVCPDKTARRGAQGLGPKVEHGLVFFNFFFGSNLLVSVSG